MLIAISGSQGSGKSTLLDAIHKQGYPVVTRKTSRSILSDWNITLDDVNRNPELCTKFQLEIAKRKFEDEIHAVKSQEVWFTERTYMDLAVFNNFNLASKNEYNDFVNEYFETCVNNSKEYTHVFYLKAGHFDVENDNVRGFNKHYSRMVDLIMEDVYTRYIPKDRLTIVNTPDLQDRVNLVLKNFF